MSTPPDFASSEQKQEALSENEAALYDRQIRLWGVEAQKRLQSAKVLVAGLNGTGAEICKNLVLAGVNVTIQDSQLAERRNLGSQFFIGEEDIGKNRAEASFEKIKELNPFVKVVCVTKTLDLLEDEDIAKHDLVCVTQATFEQKLRLNAICRKHSIGFIAVEAFGLYGYLFADHGDEYSYIETIKETAQNKDDEKIKKIERTVGFVPFSQALESSWSSFPLSKRKRIPETYYALHLLKDGKPFDYSQSLKKLKTIAEKNGIDYEQTSLFDKDAIVRLSSVANKGPELSPVCAVLGGIAGQEVMKAISRKDKPIHNFFFFDGLESKGTVRYITSA